MRDHSAKVIQVLCDKQTGEVYDTPRYLTKTRRYTKDINQAEVISVCGRMERRLQCYSDDPQYAVISVSIKPCR